ncbi:Protein DETOXIFICATION 34 [Linum grandiflorum]
MQHKRRKTSVFLSLHFSLRPSSFIAFLPPETLEIFSPYLNTISQYSCKTSSQPKPQPKLPKTETKRSEITTAANIANYKENGARGAGQSMAILQSEFSPLSIDDAPKTTNGNSSSYNDDEDDTAPLADLHHAPSKLVLDEGGDYPPVNSFHDAKSILVMESGKLWGIAGPIAFNILCNYGVNSFTNIFVGHIGDVELSAVAISLSVIANFSFGFLLGMGSALETLCGQAFGAGQVHLLGVYMQRSWLILLGACFFLLPLYLYATQILNLLGIEPDIAELAGRFTIQVIPQMFSLALNFPTQKFLQSQSNVGVLAWIGFATLVIHIILLYFFIYVFQWGLTGAAAAYDISAWGLALAQVVYVVGWCKEGWTGLSWLAFKDLWGFLKLSIASAVMICLEIWYFMVLIVLTGHLEDPVIAVGSLSICVRVSNELGSGHPRATKYAVIVTCAESLLIGLLSAGTILATRNDFAVIFTNSIEMRKAVADLAYLLGITMVLNSIQPVISGVAVGGGWQALVAYINLFCYYVVGLPLGFLLGYKTSLHVKGIWLGMIFGTFLQTLILICIICKTNWNKEVEQASERMKRWGAGNESVTSTSDTG